ncbi:MAG: hypothetical protein RH948_03755 [Cyclobacteriaceae bacterium]
MQQPDSLEVSPSSILVEGFLIKNDGLTATFKIAKVVAIGQGIINVLSEGDDVTITLSERLKNLKGHRLQIYLGEQIGIDASITSYRLISVKKK